MFDPLNYTTSNFANADSSHTSPPWPTTPHEPNSPIPNLRRPTSSMSATPQEVKSDGLYGREPKIYGQPEPGLISPQATVGSNGVKFEKREPYLRARITGLDRNRRDILVKFDAQTNLSNFTGTTYRNVSRSYLDFQQFHDALLNSCPHTIVPALPFAQTSAPTDEEDDRLVRIMLQQWLTRICEDPVIMHDEDLRLFIENDFGYQPTPRPRRKTGSGFSLIKRGVPDEDEVLQRARFELTKLETQFSHAAKAIDKLSASRKALSATHAEMGNRLVNVASTEAHPPLANALRKLGRAWHTLSDLDQAQSISECVIIGDSFGYQGINAQSAKEALFQRASVLEEYQRAVKAAISKRRNIERLRASSNIRPERVDEALEELEDANKYEQVLAQRANGISQNLHRALEVHSKTVADDVTAALIEHARLTLTYEKQLLRELEALKTDVSNAGQRVVQQSVPPKPTIVPPLEDDMKALTKSTVPLPPVPRPSSAFPASPGTPTPHVRSASLPSRQPPLPSQPASSTFASSSNAPLFGKPSHTPAALPHPLAETFSPILSSSTHRSTTSQQMFDPLSQLTSANMSQSLRVQPSRPRLDAKLAASKLANMF